jgi:hypothetical protein
MSKVSSFEYIMQTATEPSRSWSNAELAKFHYFNPNGLYAAKKASDVRIDELVDAGLAKSGAIIAYGGLSYFNTNLLSNLATAKRVGRIDLLVTLEGIERDIKTATEFIEEKKSGAV